MGRKRLRRGSLIPYTIDLARLVVSALLAKQEAHLAINVKDAANAILLGYHESMKCGGQPFVLGEKHGWLLDNAQALTRSVKEAWEDWKRHWGKKSANVE
jgi:uncharacterized protein (DUF2252 family)